MNDGFKSKINKICNFESFLTDSSLPTLGSEEFVHFNFE